MLEWAFKNRYVVWEISESVFEIKPMKLSCVGMASTKSL